MNIIIPMAGKGSRFSNAGYITPKPLIKTNGKTLIEHSLDSLNIDGNYIFITRKYKNKQYNDELSKILKEKRPNSIEILLDYDQNGAADACLKAKNFINNEEGLIITNCDQLLNWNSKDFQNFISKEMDGALVLFESNDARHSYAEIYNEKVVRVVEKNLISSHALVGVHYWKRGSDFVRSAENQIISSIDESYISSTYQILINEKKSILPFFIKKQDFTPLGTPDDVAIYEGKVREFYTEKPKTIFCDIDGTIIKHSHRFSELNKVAAEDLAGVVEKFNEWDSKGHKIILTTARKESARSFTEHQLRELGLCWDMLIMGLTSGVRVIINDKLNQQDKNRAESVNLITDVGFTSFDWKTIGL
jgi:dTDP-glucose pyrophosphorylase